MEIENLSFPEAVEFLARRANMPLPEQENDAESRKRARMLALNRDAARFFYEQLSTPAGQPARDYMAKRRIGPVTAKNFGIGFAPDSWDSLRNAMKAKGYNDFEMADAGLVRRGKTSGFYDTFRNRLMFPVIDVRGNVIGFSGRILGDGEPKYMNSPETLVFNKSRNLFALNLAKKSKSGYIILSEGNIDVVSLHQAGFDSAVASLGTSLTAEQARLLSRYTKEVIIAYDNDGAGIKASQRGISILEKLDIKVRVLRMSGAKDPDEFIKLKGPEAFRKLLESSQDQVDFKLSEIARKYDLSVREQKIEFLNEAYELVARLPDAAQRELYSRQLAGMVEVNEQAVIGEVENKRRWLLAKEKRNEQKTGGRIAVEPWPVNRNNRYSDPESAAAEEGLIRILYTDPELCRKTALPDASVFSSELLGGIYSCIVEKSRRGESTDAAFLAGVLSPEESSALIGIIDQPVGKTNRERALQDYIRKIKQRYEQRNSKQDLRSIAEEQKKTKGYKG